MLLCIPLPLLIYMTKMEANVLVVYIISLITGIESVIVKEHHRMHVMLTEEALALRVLYIINIYYKYKLR